MIIGYYSHMSDYLLTRHGLRPVVRPVRMLTVQGPDAISSPIRMAPLRFSLIHLLTACVLSTALPAAVLAQTPGPTGPIGPRGNFPSKPDPIERVTDTFYRMGSIRIDTAKREVTVPGKVNSTESLEFLANTRSDFRTYESAIQLDAFALNFNVAMLLIGLDKANSSSARYHFDPAPPKGDVVEVWVEWKSGNETKRVRAEELFWDVAKKEKFPLSPWVYTGSEILPTGSYLADVDGVVIGFVHDPASIIEWTGTNGLGRFGFIKLDPKLGLEPGTAVTVLVKAIGSKSK